MTDPYCSSCHELLSGNRHEHHYNRPLCDDCLFEADSADKETPKLSKYTVEWTREQWWRVTIEAGSQELALEKFWLGEYDNEQQYGSEIQEGIDITEVE